MAGCAIAKYCKIWYFVSQMLYLNEVYAPDEVINGPNLLTFEGTARAGKGTSGKAVIEALQEDGRDALLIDQGQKFRTVTLLALEKGVDLSDEAALQAFLEAEATYQDMLGYLERVAAMPEDELQNTLYAERIKCGVSTVSKQGVTHDMAVRSLFDQVREAGRNDVDTVVVDGRTLEKYGRQMHAEKLGIYVAGFYFQCDSMVAARRVLKEFRDLKDMSGERKLELLAEVEKISKRNDDDAKRTVDPMRYPDHAYNLDLLRGLPQDPDERAEELGQIALTRLVAVQTSHTTSIEQMTTPVVEICRYLLEDADMQCRSWNMAVRAQQVHAELVLQ